MDETSSLPGSKHFRLERLADGLYVSIASDTGAATCNAGIVDLGDRTLIFDPFLTPTAAEDLRAAAAQLTNRPVAYVVNSHYHNDHIRGNQVFSADTDIISTTLTRELIATKGVDEIHWDTGNSPEQLHLFEECLKTEADANTRKDIAFWVAYHRSIIESLPTLKLRLPNRTFDKRLVFHGSRRTAEVISFGGGHTESDSILYLPAERITFMGDLVFIGCHPYLADGDPQEWLQSLAQTELLGLKTLVPGHGSVGTADDLALMRQYITELEALAAEVVKAEGSADQAAERAIPSRFEMWRFARFFPTNMRFLHDRISKTRGVTG